MPGQGNSDGLNIVIDESRDPLLLKKQDINLKKALSSNQSRAQLTKQSEKFNDILKQNSSNFN